MRIFTQREYRDLITDAHSQLSSGRTISVPGNLTARARAGKHAVNSRPWPRISRLPSYAPDLGPVEGIWSAVKRGPFVGPAFGDFV